LVRAKENADKQAKENIDSQEFKTTGISSNALRLRNFKKIHRQISSNQKAESKTENLQS